MKNKIALVALNAKYIHSNLAIYDLYEYAKCNRLDNIRNKVELLVEEYTINHNLDEILQSIYRKKADVLAFSCYIWNKKEILQIASDYKKISPETLIILGGPEVSYDSKKLLEENVFIDGIIVGEGEQAFLELCNAVVGGEANTETNTEANIEANAETNTETYKEAYKEAYTELNDSKDYEYSTNGYEYISSNSRYQLENVSNLVYRKGSEIITNPIVPLLNLDDVPFIYNDLTKFQNKILYYESSRGCPFSCSYCLSSIDKTVRFRSLDLVKKELEFFLNNNVNQVKFIDRTFNCDKIRAVEIWKYLRDNDNGITNFHFEVAADLINEEALEVISGMRKGLIQLEIGLQTTNSETLTEIKRTMNIEQLKKVMLTINSFQNTHQHLDLIAGLPYETLEIFKNSFDEAYAMKPNQLQLGFLKVLKGSYMETMASKYNLIYQASQPFEVLGTKWISYDELLELKSVERVVEVYYNSDQYKHALDYLLTAFSGAYQMYKELGNYYSEVNESGTLLGREAKYKLLLDFSNEKNITKQLDLDLLKDLLIFDYYLRENAKSRPSFARTDTIPKEEYIEFFKNRGNKELSIDNVDYDSKIVARKMHIEPVREEMKQWIKESIIEKGKYGYAVFDYDNRNPLDKSARVYIIGRLK